MYFVLVLAIILALIQKTAVANHDHDNLNIPDVEDECPKNPGGKCNFQLHSVRARNNFGEMAEERGFTTVAELGVQSGRFADMFLYVAPSITKVRGFRKYYVVCESRVSILLPYSISSGALEVLILTTLSC